MPRIKGPNETVISVPDHIASSLVGAGMAVYVDGADEDSPVDSVEDGEDDGRATRNPGRRGRNPRKATDGN